MKSDDQMAVCDLEVFGVKCEHGLPGTSLEMFVHRQQRHVIIVNKWKTLREKTIK